MPPSLFKYTVLTVATVGATFLLAVGGAQADVFTLNYEAPGALSSTATFSVEGVETFDGRSVGTGTGFTTDYGTSGAITGTYSGPFGLQINSADQYGGAGGVGNYAVAFNGTPYTVALVADPVKDPQGINYFGYWLSALDAGNLVTFYRNGVQVGQLDPGQVTSAVSGNSAYYGNPNANFLGQDSNEPFVFVNFYDKTGTFDTVSFTQIGGGGYESDNHTVGYFTKIGGVPEPTGWALMLTGLGAIGAAARARRKSTAATV